MKEDVPEPVQTAPNFEELRNLLQVEQPASKTLGEGVREVYEQCTPVQTTGVLSTEKAKENNP